MEWIVGAVILTAILVAILKPRQCDICHTYFKRKYYTWKIDGEKQHLCPNCNGKMQRKVSSQKFKNRFG
ncbi:hypothetical protein DP185_07725 [Enterobacter hormaechei]|uniref:hypothetical protein n=1 Tax=Enterobacter quasihormaechei TaxID=2529382 RepID=UPI000DCD0BA4|nr:hypothetical protein DP185_07725 [Enterobacter hormaechei]